MLNDQKEEKRTISFSGFDAPNYTQVPDQVFDELLTQLSGAELKVLLYIIRRTFGFKKESDNISLSQMLNGIVTREGQVLDRGVGLSKKTLLAAINTLEDNGIIRTERRSSPEKGDEPTVYRLVISRASQQPKGEKSTPPVGEKVPHGGGVETTPEGWSRNYTTQETVLQETDLQISNIRRAEPLKRNQDREEQGQNTVPTQRLDAGIPGTLPRPSKAATSSTPRNSDFEGISSVLVRGHRQPASQPDEARQVVLEYVEDFAREFNDQATLKSSTSRAYNLFQKSGLTIGGFIAQMHEARALTKESTAQIRSQANSQDRAAPKKKKMAYFFACLEDRLGLRENEDDNPSATSVQKTS